MVEDKDEISRLRGETKRLTAELAAERAAHSSVQIESGELNSIRLKYNELMLELAQLKGEHSNLGVYRAQECVQSTRGHQVTMTQLFQSFGLIEGLVLKTMKGERGPHPTTNHKYIIG